MVDVVTTAIRSQAKQAQAQIAGQQKQLARQREQLGREQQRLGSAQVLRSLSREQRQLQTRQLSSATQQLQSRTQQLQTTSRELTRISRLPTARELQSQTRQQAQSDLKLARVASRDKSIAIASLPKNIRSLVQKVRAGQSDAAIIKRAEESLGQSLSAIDRQAVLDLSKGISFEEISAQQSLISTPISARDLPTISLPSARLGSIVAAPQLKGLDRQIQNVQKQLFQLEQKPISARTTSQKIKITGLQAKLDTLRVARATTTPIKTTKEIGISAAQLGREVGKFAISTEGKETPLAGISQELRTRPEATTLSFAALALGAVPIPLGKITKLTSLSRLKASNKDFVFQKPPKGFKKTPLQIAFKEEVKFGIKDSEVISFLKTQFKNQGGDFSKLGTVEKDFLVGQVKARIKANPELFIPKARKEALKKVGVKEKDLSKFTKARLEGDFPQLVLKEQLRRGDLTDLQQRTLARVGENLEKKRIKTAIETGPTPIRRSQLLSEIEREFILKQFEAQVRARKLDLTPSQRNLLQKVKTKEEFARIRKAILEGKKPISPEEFLTNFEKSNIVRQIEAQVRANPELTLTPAQRIALRRVKTKSELARVKKAIEKGSDDILPSELISKEQRASIESRFGVQARAKEFQRFGQRQQVLVQKPVIEIKSAQITPAQQALLRRLKESKTAQATAIREVRQAKEVTVPKPEALKSLQTNVQRTKQQQLQLQKQLQGEGKRLKQTQSSRQTFVKTQEAQLARLQKRQQSLNKQGISLASPQRAAIASQILLQKQAVNQAQQFAQKGALQLESFFSAFAQVQGIAQPQSFAQRVAQRSGLLKKKRIPFPKVIPFPRTGLLKRTKKQIRESKQGYNAFARPQGSKKLMKLNIRPLSKSRAKDTMAWFVDNSLSATGSIKKTKGKIKQSILGIPSGYSKNTARKFREYKIRKGKPILTKNRFIEFRARRLDTIREKKKIKLAALVKRKRKAVSKRIPAPKFKKL